MLRILYTPTSFRLFVELFIVYKSGYTSPETTVFVSEYDSGGVYNRQVPIANGNAYVIGAYGLIASFTFDPVANCRYFLATKPVSEGGADSRLDSVSYTVSRSSYLYNTPP